MLQSTVQRTQARLTACIAAFITFVTAYLLLRAYSFVQYSWRNGPLPSVSDGVLVALLLGVCAGMITYLRKRGR